jgi:hypothetical protein
MRFLPGPHKRLEIQGVTAQISVREVAAEPLSFVDR